MFWNPLVAICHYFRCAHYLHITFTLSNYFRSCRNCNIVDSFERHANKFEHAHITTVVLLSNGRRKLYVLIRWNERNIFNRVESRVNKTVYRYDFRYDNRYCVKRAEKLYIIIDSATVNRFWFNVVIAWDRNMIPFKTSYSLLMHLSYGITSAYDIIAVHRNRFRPKRVIVLSEDRLYRIHTRL